MALSLTIVIATPLYPPDVGGPATYAHELRERFIAAGHSVALVTFSDLLELFGRYLGGGEGGGREGRHLGSDQRSAVSFQQSAKAKSR